MIRRYILKGYYFISYYFLLEIVTSINIYSTSIRIIVISYYKYNLIITVDNYYFMLLSILVGAYYIKCF